MTFDGSLLAGMSVLAQVVESGSFVRAAQRLELSPSGVSRSMSRLEARLGVRLIERTTRTLKVTDEGRALYERARPHLNAIVEAAALAAGSAQAVRGTLRVNIDPHFARVALAGRLADFLERFPELNLELVTRDAIGDLVADRFDLAVRFGDPPRGALVARRIAQTRVLTVAAPRYLSRYGRPGNPKEVAQHRRILFPNPLTGRPFEWEFRRGREVVEIAAEGNLLVSDPGAMLTACCAGAGIAQTLALGTENLLADGRLIDLFPDWPGERFPLYALYPSRSFVPAKMTAFLDFCVAAIRPNAATVTATAVSKRRSRP
jgi:DNA-binding transcriptional LysR family regulator